jgi:environmental stress-induced protein Ves
MNTNLNFVHFLPAQEAVLTPWKNQLGYSRQIAIEPPGVDFAKDPFLWRISSATVEQTCEFSAFPDFLRILAVVKGTQMVLHLDQGQEMAALQLGEVFEFTGSSSVRAELARGPITDLGIIFDPKNVRAKMTKLTFKSKPRSFTLTQKAVLFYVVSGQVSASVYPGEIAHALGVGDVLRINELAGYERIILLEPKAENTALMVVEIDW